MYLVPGTRYEVSGIRYRRTADCQLIENVELYCSCGSERSSTRNAAADAHVQGHSIVNQVVEGAP